MHRLVVWGLLLVACGRVEKMGADASIDASSVDADARARYRYVIDRVLLPSNSEQARTYSLDIDGDELPDNQLGALFATLANEGLSAQPAFDFAIDRGEVIQLAEFATESLADAQNATFELFVGSDPQPPACNGSADTTCRRHLTGSASFSVDATPESPLVGDVSSGVYDGGPGRLPFWLLLRDAAPIRLTLLSARVQLNMPTESTIGSGKLVGAIAQNDVDTRVVPAFRDSFQAAVARDCTALSSPPNCGCADGSDGLALVGLFDTNPRDCNLSVDELRESTLVQALLAPDVQVEATPALSIGVRMTAVAARFTP